MRSFVVVFHKIRRLLPLMIAVVFLVGIAGTAYAQTTFRLIPPANPGTFPTLSGVGTSSVSNSWAVGATSNSTNSKGFTLIEHWNGQSWQVVPSPSPFTVINILTAVAVLSSTNVWAVGTGNNSLDSTTNQPLIEHWNGTKWSAVAAGTDTNGINDELAAISAVSANDIWAVGSHFTSAGGAGDALIEHWNGTKWSVVANPTNPSFTGLVSVAAISSTDVWAAGGTRPSSVGSVTLEHWNGQSWSLVSAPGVSNSFAGFNSLTAISSNDIWGVGSSTATPRFSPTLPLIEHWNGTQWSIVASASGPSRDLRSVAAVASNDVWAVNSNGGTSLALEHWDGTQWSFVAVPVPTGSQFSDLKAIAAVPSGTVLAIGRSDSTTLALLNDNA